MPATTRCPMCQFTFPSRAGTRAECPSCFETFDPNAAPKPKPAREDAPIPLADVVDDDDIPVVVPIAAVATAARPVATVVATAKRPELKPAARKTVGTPKITRRDDDDDEPPRTPNSEWRVIAAGVVGLVLIGGVVAAAFYVGKRSDKPVVTTGTTRARNLPEPIELQPKQNPPPAEWPPPFPPPAPVEPPAKPVVVPAAEVVEIKPTAAADGTVVPLLSATDHLCVVGGGRFLIFRLPKDRQIAVFDANAGRIVRYLPLLEPNGVLAAGMTKLFVLLPTANIFQRWNLLTFEKEQSAPNPTTGLPRTILMGHQTDGPLLVVGPNQFVDTATLKPLALPVGSDGWRGISGMTGHPSYPPQVRVSADGRVFAWTGGLAGGMMSLTLADGDAKLRVEQASANSLVPGPDGTLFASTGIYTPDFKPRDGKPANTARSVGPVPALHGPFYLDPTWEPRVPHGTIGDTPGPPLALKLLGATRPLLTLTSLAGTETRHRGLGMTSRPLQDRVFLIPAANLLAVLGPGEDRLHLHAFNLKERLEQSGDDYLFVMDRPHPAASGKNYRYAPDVWSKKGGVKIKLDAGPDGMKVVGNSVTWKVPTDFTGTADVTLTVSDAGGREAVHTFEMAVPPAK